IITLKAHLKNDVWNALGQTNVSLNKVLKVIDKLAGKDLI
ncbi:hypothetical protein LCGC14_2704530, partial [marine sediment metagenome]